MPTEPSISRDPISEGSTRTETGSQQPEVGKTIRVRLENGDVVDGRVLNVYNLPEGTPNGSFRIEFKDPRSGGVREYTAWREQITTKEPTPRRYNG